jgi:hypothetical protein
MGKVQPDASLDVRPRQLGEDLDSSGFNDQHESSCRSDPMRDSGMWTYDASISSTWGFDVSAFRNRVTKEGRIPAG